MGSLFFCFRLSAFLMSQPMSWDHFKQEKNHLPIEPITVVEGSYAETWAAAHEIAVKALPAA